LDGLDPWSIPLPDYARVNPLLPPSWPRDADGICLVLPVADGHVRVLAVTPRQLRGFVRLLAGRAPARVDPGERRSQGGPGGGTPPRILDAWSRLVKLGREALRFAAPATQPMLRVLPTASVTITAMRASLAVTRATAALALRRRTRADVTETALRLGVP